VRVTILGGAGFAGAHLAVHLAHQGLAVQALDSLVRPGSEHNLARLAAAGVELVRGDVRCAEDWGAVRRHDPEAIVDCAAQPSAVAGYRNPRLDFTTNTFAVLRGLEYCRETGAGFLLFSTNKVYGQRAVEQAFQDFANGISRMVEDHGGGDNAFTMKTPTTYHEIVPRGALATFRDLRSMKYSWSSRPDPSTSVWRRKRWLSVRTSSGRSSCHRGSSTS